jgi:hypothetical protein
MLLDENNMVINGEHCELTPRRGSPMSKPAIRVQINIVQAGWSSDLITEYLGKLGKIVPNPNYRSGPHAKLHKLNRVIEVEEAGLLEVKPLVSRNSPIVIRFSCEIWPAGSRRGPRVIHLSGLAVPGRSPHNGAVDGDLDLQPRRRC